MRQPDWQTPDGRIRLYHGDCMDVMAAMDAGSVDHVITDPPYSERTHDGHDSGVNGHIGEGKDSSVRESIQYAALTTAQVACLCDSMTPLCKGWIVWMCDHHLALRIQKNLEQCGRYVFAPLPYYAPGSRVRLAGDGPSSWTVWMVVSRTKAQSKWGTLPGGYLYQSGWDKAAITGGKPVALMEAIVSDYSRRDDVVMDPFMGAGSTGIACVRLGRQFIGIEQNRERFDLSVQRIQSALDETSLLDYAAEQQEIAL